MSRKYRSEAMAAIHETMSALHEVGVIGKLTMRQFDTACLAEIHPLKRKRSEPYEKKNMSAKPSSPTS